MELWIIFVVLYGILKGLREPVKKKALSKDSLLGVLFVYTFVGFLMVIPTAKDVFNLTFETFILVFIKSFSVFLAWILSFLSVKKMPVSLFGVIDLSRVIFSTLLGVFFLKETLSFNGFLGLCIVLLGIYLVNRKKESDGGEFERKYVFFTLISCALNAVSGTLDKYIMSKNVISSENLQFWFMLLMSLMYLAYILIKREKINIKSCIKNPYIYLLSIMLIVADKMLFIANADPNSKVTIMTLLKQSSVFVTIASGKIIYKEKHILYKSACALLIFVGIVLALF